jgi:hypothetical protein
VLRERRANVGYYVSLHSSDWELTESPELLAVLKEMPTKYHSIKRGGSSNGESWFSWVNDSEFESATKAEEIVNAFGFETTESEGTFCIEGYNNKTGQEDLLLAVLAPFVKEGSEMEWSGEEGERWLYSVIGGKLFVSGETRTWDRPEQYKYMHFESAMDADGKFTSKTFLIDPYEPLPEGIVSRWDKKKVEA